MMNQFTVWRFGSGLVLLVEAIPSRPYHFFWGHYTPRKELQCRS